MLFSIFRMFSSILVWLMWMFDFEGVYKEMLQDAAATGYKFHCRKIPAILIFSLLTWSHVQDLHCCARKGQNRGLCQDTLDIPFYLVGALCYAKKDKFEPIRRERRGTSLQGKPYQEHTHSRGRYSAVIFHSSSSTSHFYLLLPHFSSSFLFTIFPPL